jgi:hypothetical protein
MAIVRRNHAGVQRRVVEVLTTNAELTMEHARREGLQVEPEDCPKRTAWLEELSAKYKAKYGRNCP